MGDRDNLKKFWKKILSKFVSKTDDYSGMKQKKIEEERQEQMAKIYYLEEEARKKRAVEEEEERRARMWKNKRANDYQEDKEKAT